MSRYREADLGRIRTRPVSSRKSLVDVAALAGPMPPEAGILLDHLPDFLAAKSLRAVVKATSDAAMARRKVAILAGAHVVKTGCGPLLIQLMEQGVVTSLSLNGAAAIHDFELAAFGTTSEDVGAGLSDGSFGMAEETASLMNEATRVAYDRQEGLGEGLGRTLLETGAANAGKSLLASAYRLSVPLTVHVAIGTDILHQHPSAHGAAIGETSLRDFRILAAALSPLAGGVVINIGSAVILPEVFMKAMSVLLNGGEAISDLTTCDFDFIRHYRPLQNVVGRPVAEGRGRGYSITGHHEILLPLFTAAVIRQLSRTT